jgi:hypothetical protein
MRHLTSGCDCAIAGVASAAVPAPRTAAFFKKDLLSIDSSLSMGDHDHPSTQYNALAGLVLANGARRAIIAAFHQCRASFYRAKRFKNLPWAPSTIKQDFAPARGTPRPFARRRRARPRSVAALSFR